MLRYFAILSILLAFQADARPGADSNYNISVGPTYTGPGDIVSGAGAWYGLRAYNAAQAAANAKSVNLRRASDNATCDFAVSSLGGFGVSVATCATGLGLTLATFATQDATATCTIATTTATCTSGSGVPHAGSTITGAGLTQPCYASAAGVGTAPSFTIALAGSFGSSPCGTVGVGETLTFTYGLYVTKAYDQSGHSADASQATAAKQPQVLPTCLNSLPCFSFVGTAAQILATGATLTASAIPDTFSWVVLYPSAGATFQKSMASGTPQSGHNNAANNIYIFAGGSALGATAADLSWHAVQGVIATGTTSVTNVDGTPTTSGASVGSASSATTLNFGGDGAGSFMTGLLAEGGFWPGTGFTSGQQTSVCHNQFSYWGTSTSC